MIPILLLVSVATFILVDCTAGDPARVMLQGSTGNPSTAARTWAGSTQNSTVFSMAGKCTQIQFR